jgi:hypothetical protein
MLDGIKAPRAYDWIVISVQNLFAKQLPQGIGSLQYITRYICYRDTDNDAVLVGVGHFHDVATDEDLAEGSNSVVGA